MKPQTSCGCSRGHPTETLKSEHRVIERVLDAVERFATRDEIDAEAFRLSIDFLRNFADGCHHAKEENELFPRMEAVGVARDGGPIGCMLDEHTRGRALIRGMAENVERAGQGDVAAARALRAAALDYIDLLRKHIWKEDNILFAMADRVLDEPRQSELAAGFDRTEQAQEPGKHDRYIRLAEDLYNRSLGRQAETVS